MKTIEVQLPDRVTIRQSHEAVRRIISDTGQLLHLTEARALQLMELAGDVSVPRQVAGEMAHLVPYWRTPAWITVEPLLEPYLGKTGWRRLVTD